jgi:glutathione S-transferase
VEEDGTVLADSPAILRRLEELYPEPPLWPAEPTRRAELDCFVDWFNGVWKRPPNLMAEELGRPVPDPERIAAWEAELTAALDRFEALLDGRDFLFGGELTAADVVAFPFLKYAALPDDPADTDFFHRVRRERQPLDGRPRVRDWIARIDALPRA